MNGTRPINLMDEVRAAYRSGEVSCSLLARASARSYSATSRAIRGITDVGETDARGYFTALMAIRDERRRASLLESATDEPVQ